MGSGVGLFRLPKTPCPFLESDNFYSTRIPALRQFCHLRGELIHSDGVKTILLLSDSVEHQDMPTAGSYPSADILICGNWTAVHIK